MLPMLNKKTRRSSTTIVAILISSGVSLSLISSCADIGEPVQSTPTNNNRAPALERIGERYVAFHSALQFIVSATDVESIPTLTATNLPDGAVFVDSGNGRGLFSWIPTLSQSSSVSSVTFIATDDSSATDMEIVQLNVVALTFNNFISFIVQTSCQSSGCHGGSDSASAFSVNTYTSFIAGGFAGSGIVPGDTAASVVLQKLGTTPPFGSRMPLTGGPLPQSTIDNIALWILAGAPES